MMREKRKEMDMVSVVGTPEEAKVSDFKKRFCGIKMVKM